MYLLWYFYTFKRVMIVIELYIMMLYGRIKEVINSSRSEFLPFMIIMQRKHINNKINTTKYSTLIKTKRL